MYIQRYTVLCSFKFRSAFPCPRASLVFTISIARNSIGNVCYGAIASREYFGNTGNWYTLNITWIIRIN